jgi:hypothetical protein
VLFRRGLTYEYALLWDGEEGDRVAPVRPA